MKCPNCNKQVEANAKFCQSCGEEIIHQNLVSGDDVAVGGSNIFKGITINAQGWGWLIGSLLLLTVVLFSIVKIIELLRPSVITIPTAISPIESTSNGKEMTQVEASNTPFPTNTPIENNAEKIIATNTPYPTYTPYPTNTSPALPKADNFIACLTPCDSSGANIVSTFPEKSTELYVQWEYTNVPIGADYIRKWTMNDREWVRYECSWLGPQSGIENIKLWEVGGLHSGEWQVTIIIDDVIILQESIYIQGDWDYWDPAGYFDQCYGNR